MTDVSLEEIFALNEEIAALATAGVPIDLGEPTKSIEHTLSQVNARLALRTSLGQSVKDAIANEPELPPIYQNALLIGLEANKLSLALEGVTREAAASDDLRQTLERSLVRPLILLLLAYIGLIVLCLSFVPTLASNYEQMREAPSASLQILIFFREWMAVWVPGVPLLILIGILLWRRRVANHPTWQPVKSSYLKTAAQSTYAEQLASLLEADVPLAQSLQLAGKASPEPMIHAATNAIVSAHDHSEPLSAAQGQAVGALSPLLRWALVSDLGKDQLPAILRFISDTYRDSAKRKALVWHFLLPTLVGACVGGLIVLVYGLSLFEPYTQFLYDVAN